MDVKDWKSRPVHEEDQRFGNSGDVGVTFISDKSGRALSAWKFVFLLAPNNLLTEHNIIASKLFGKITKGFQFFLAMSSTSKRDREGITFFIESSY